MTAYKHIARNWFPAVSLNKSLLTQWWCDGTKKTFGLNDKFVHLEIGSKTFPFNLLLRTIFNTRATVTFKIYKIPNSKRRIWQECTSANLRPCLGGVCHHAGHPIFTKSTLINISALPTRLNLSSVHCNRLNLTDRPYSLHDRACQSKHKDNPVMPAYTAYNKKHLWWPFSEVLALAFWSN